MQLVPTDKSSDQDEDTVKLSGLPLSVVIAEGTVIEAVRKHGAGDLPLEPPYHVSDEDAYLVLPDDIGMEIVDIVKDHDFELLHETLRDSLIVIGGVGKDENGGMTLSAEEVYTPADVLPGLDYAASVKVGGGQDALAVANALPHVQITVVSKLLDDEGLDRVLRKREYLGKGWRVPMAGLLDETAGVDPTYVWSKRLADRIGIELALFMEYEELVVLLKPVCFVP